MNSIFPIDSGGIILSYKCNSRCRHCLYAAGPDWNDWMDVEDARLIFQGLLETSTRLQGFHLAGGEPFLDFDRLLRIQKLATEYGIPIEYVETNAGWCVDEDDSRRKFEQLGEAGMRCVLVSCSPFHAERIPLQRVETAIRAGYDALGPEGVILWVPDFYKQLAVISTERTIPLEEYAAGVGESMSKYMIRSGYSLISGGRVGYELADYYKLEPPEHCGKDSCRLEILESGHAHFDPYGNLFPAFCSGMTLGDARDMRSLLLSFDLNRLPIVKMLVEEGPYALYRFAVEEFGYTPNPSGYVGKCHLCVDVRRWIIQQTERFAELAPAKFYEQLTR